MDDLGTSDDALNELFEEVKYLESTYGGGQKLGKAGKAINSVRETSIRLGIPWDKLIHLTPEGFERNGIMLNEIWKQQILSKVNFYYMTMPVNLFGKPGVQFDDLILSLDFGSNHECTPIIQAMFPTTEWKDVLSYGGELTLGLNANLGWSAGVNLSDKQIPILMKKLPGSISANVANKNKYKAFITVPKFNFSIGRKEISAVGQGNSICQWTVSKPQLHKEDNVEFGLVFKVPNVVKTIALQAEVTAKPSLDWLVAKLQHVLDALSQGAIDILKGKKPVQIRDGEKWTLTLPE